jgi:membrane-associated phospholipid phosphatase
MPGSARNWPPRGWPVLPMIHGALQRGAVYVRAAARDVVKACERADRAVIAALPAWRSPRGVIIARAVSAMAEPAAAGVLVAVAALVAGRRRGRAAPALPVLAVPAGVFARWVLSEAIARPRPPSAIWLAEPHGFSMPSRHTALAALTAGALVRAAGTGGLARHAVPFAAAASVGASRVYLGVHWPSDVLAGWLAAAAWLTLAVRLSRRAAVRRSM